MRFADIYEAYPCSRRQWLQVIGWHALSLGLVGGRVGRAAGEEQETAPRLPPQARRVRGLMETTIAL